jgi:DNA modification methylase
MERTLAEHLDVMVDVFREVWRVVKPNAAVWINYGDCYATQPNGRSAADTKAAGRDDRTFRDKPFSTVGGTLKAKDLCMVPNRLAIALQDDGWWVRSEIVWGKPNPMPDSSGRYRPSTAHEKIFLLSKSGNLNYDAEAVSMPVTGSTHSRVAQNVAAQIGSTRANAGGKTNGNMKAVVKKTKQDGHSRRHDGFNARWKAEHALVKLPKIQAPESGDRNNTSFIDSIALNVETRYLRNFEPAPLSAWTIATAAFGESHFATFPPELVERCLTACSEKGGVVLDPFGGAGTVGVVAENMGFDSILIELNPEYAAIADNRIRASLGRVAGKPLARNDLPEMLRMMEQEPLPTAAE